MNNDTGCEIAFVSNLSDIERIITLCDSAFDEPVHSRSYFRELIDKIYSFGKFITIHIDGNVCGYAAFYVNNYETKEAYLTLIAVHPQYQGEKIGVKLLDEFERIATENKFENCKLEVNCSNINAIGFYQHCGYIQYERTSRNTLYMIKNIQTH